MLIINANWLPRFDIDSDNYIKDLYEIDDIEQYINDYELTKVTKLYPDKYRFIAFVESDGEINCLLTLEDLDDEHLLIYSENDGKEETIFNSEAMPVIKLIRNNEEIAIFLVQNEPWDLNFDPHEKRKLIIPSIIEKIKQINSHKKQQYDITEENVLIVRQL